MIILDATTRAVEVLLGGAVTTNQLPVVASYVDVTTTTYTPGSSNTATNNSNPVTAVAAPAASTERQVKLLTVYNADTASATLTVRYNDNGTPRIITQTTLSPGDSLIYTDGEGFRVIDTNGNIKQTVGAVNAATLTGTTLASNVVNSSLTTVGTIGTGVWNASIVTGAYGGTGVNNGSRTITVGGNVAFSGAYSFTGTLTGNTSITYPTSGTLATLGANTFTGSQTFSPSSGIAGYVTAGAFEEAAYSNGNSGTSLAVNLDNGNLQTVTITGAVAITMTTPTHPGKWTLIVTQDGTGHTYSFSGVKWASGTQPPWSNGANDIDVVSFLYDGTHFYGMGGIAFA